MSESPLLRHPEFVPSLRVLVEREQYADCDIGPMFGVSRERVRQWRNQYGITRDDRGGRGLNAVRVWDDQINRFRPVRRGVVIAEGKARRRSEKSASRVQRLQRQQARIIGIAIGLQAALGRTPTLREIACAVVGREVSMSASGAILTGRWESSKRPTRDRYRELTAALRAAGIGVRRPGRLRHHEPEQAEAAA